MRKFSPEIEKFLNNLDSDVLAQFKNAKSTRKRQPRRTVTLSPEIYERLKDYAERHDQSISEVANRKLEAIPTEPEEAEIDALMAASKMQQQAFDDLFTVQPTRMYVN